MIDYLKKNIALATLTVLGFVLRLFYAHLDPFIHKWDERFHALVARNMMDHPFIPKLIKSPLVPYDTNGWTTNSIWLHKQPLFLWQMALSMKVFGVSEFTMRLPSVLLGTLMILIVYRIAFLLTKDKLSSLLAAALMCFSHYQLEQISGFIGMDHNDVAFSFYILASIWAYVEFQLSNKLHWSILVGLFSGLAILNKWLTGLIVYLPWGLSILHAMLYKRDWKPIKAFLLSLLVCCITFLPWQIYILSNFHENAVHEYQYNSEHIWRAIEGHGGDVWYYLNYFPYFFGQFLPYLLPFGFLIVVLQKTDFIQKIHFSLSTAAVAILLFFSVIAQTKLPSYVFIVAPICLIYLAIALKTLADFFRNKWLHIGGLLVVIWLSFNLMDSIKIRTEDPERVKLIYNTKIYKNLSHRLPDYIKTMTNTSYNSFDNVLVMFYNNDLTAYDWCIDTKYLDSLKKEKVYIGAFKNHGNNTLSDGYYAYPYLYILDERLED